MDKAIIKAFIKKYWRYAILIGLLVVIYFLFNRTKHLESSVNDLKIQAKDHEIKAKFYKSIYDKLMEKDNELQLKYDSLVTEREKIKIEYREKIKLIDKYTVSDMQQYFDERTK
jgi:hypothetical protein